MLHCTNIIEVIQYKINLIANIFTFISLKFEFSLATFSQCKFVSISFHYYYDTISTISLISVT